MGKYSIKDLEQLSGIKAHTLRIWEQRYNFIKPERTDTNIRNYCDEDLKLILNISLLKEKGYKISKIAQLSEQELMQKVINVTENDLKYPDQISALTLAMIDLDEDRFDRIMSNNILRHGFENTMIQIVYPFLARIGIMWQTGSVNPAQEHFITNLIRQKLIVAIDGCHEKKKHGAKTFLLYLPEGELHEISLLFACYLVKSKGHKAVYLGQTLPYADLKSAYEVHNPEFIFTVLTYTPEENTQNYLNKLCRDFSDSRIYVTGFQVVNQPIDLPDNLHLIKTFHDWIDLLGQS